MKTIYGVLAIFLFSFCNSANAQYVTIPDSAFRFELMRVYPGCFNSAGQMDTTCSAIVNDTLFSIRNAFYYPNGSNVYITNIEGIQYFKNVQSLGFQDWYFRSIHHWPPRLKYFGIIGGIDTLPSSFPDSLTGFSALSNGLSIFSLQSLPAWPSTLTTLTINYAPNLTSLPTLPNGLTYLNCYGNFLLDSLPPLPNSLKFLNAGYNILLKQLPLLPKGLETLYCYNDSSLTSLPALPDSLKFLNCQNNSLLTSLPSLPKGLKELTIYSTKITCLPVLPNNIEKLYFDPNVTRCIPNINNNLIAQYTSQYPFTLPRLCNATNNINGCTAYPVIAGYAFYDANSNGVKETNEFYKANNKIQLSNGNITYTNDSGYYEIGTTTLGSYTLTPSNTYFNLSPASKTFTFISYDTTVFQNFAYQPTAVVDSLEVFMTPTLSWRVKQGRVFGYRIDARNVGSGNLGATSIKVTYDNTKLTFDSVSNSSVVHSGNILVLNLPSFPIGSKVSFNLYFTGKINTIIGDSAKGIVIVSSGTHTARDSAINFVANSYDPNDKTATPRLSPSQVVSGKYIDYTIRYQNTGNDTAYHVVVTDTLSSQLQANTLEMVSTSHNTKTTIIGNAVSFEMRNILLPDRNVNEIKSHGFIRFRIKPKNTLVLGDSVKNKAAIYFDYNIPVITNTAITQIRNESTLPLKLILFKGNKSSEGNIHLLWTTANEMNTKQFVVEQSTNGLEFTSIGIVKANGFGNSNYSFDVTNPSKVDLYFRLKMIDIDGAFSYSPIVLIKDKISNAGFALLENPVKKEMVLTSIAASLMNTEAVLVNNLGVMVKRFVIRSATQTVVINDLTNGVYYLKTVDGSEKVVIGR